MTHLIWQYYLIFKRARKPDNSQGKRVILLAAVSELYHLPHILRALVLNDLSPLRLSQKEHSAP